MQEPARIQRRRVRAAAGVALALGLLVSAGPATAARGGRASHQARLAAAETTIQTMPAIPGAVFILANRYRFTAGPDGTVQIPTLLLGTFRGHAGPAGVTVRTYHFTDGGYAVPDGWWGTQGGRRPMTVGFKVYRPFTMKFLRPVSQDAKGGNSAAQPVSPDIIDRVTLKGSTGGLIQINHGSGKTPDIGKPHYYQIEHVVSRQGGPYVSPIQYRIKFVYISGTNVVRSLQQSFCVDYDCNTLQPKQNSLGYFDLIFYRASFSVTDTLLPHSIGQGVILTFPDGQKREYAFTSPGKVTIEALPRGKYLVAVDAPGFGFTRPLTLTRDQDVKLQVISYIDLAIVGVLLSSIVIGLVVVRRPHLLGLKRKAPKATP